MIDLTPILFRKNVTLNVNDTTGVRLDISEVSYGDRYLKEI